MFLAQIRKVTRRRPPLRHACGAGGLHHAHRDGADPDGRNGRDFGHLVRPVRPVMKWNKDAVRGPMETEPTRRKSDPFREREDYDRSHRI